MSIIRNLFICIYRHKRHFKTSKISETKVFKINELVIITHGWYLARDKIRNPCLFIVCKVQNTLNKPQLRLFIYLLYMSYHLFTVPIFISFFIFLVFLLRSNQITGTCSQKFTNQDRKSHYFLLTLSRVTGVQSTTATLTPPYPQNGPCGSWDLEWELNPYYDYKPKLVGSNVYWY